MADLTNIPITPGSPPQSEIGHPGSGRTRRVPVVMTPLGPMQCIWRSHETIMADVNGDGRPIPANECVLLFKRHPLTTIRAEVDAHAWDHLDTCPVEW